MTTGEEAPNGLTYVHDSEPGIRRRRSGRGFCYFLPDGARLGEGPELFRVKSIGIPPAWTDVWICADPQGHLQATGRDARENRSYGLTTLRNAHVSVEKSVLRFDFKGKSGRVWRLKVMDLYQAGALKVRYREDPDSPMPPEERATLALLRRWTTPGKKTEVTEDTLSALQASAEALKGGNPHP